MDGMSMKTNTTDDNNNVMNTVVSSNKKKHTRKIRENRAVK